MPTALCATSTPSILEWRPTSPSAASTCWLPSGTSWTSLRKAAATGTPVSTTAQKSRPPPSRFISNARSIISTVRIAAFAVSQAQLSPHHAIPETVLSRTKAHIEASLSRGNAVSISGGSRTTLPEGFPTIRSEAVSPIGPWSIALNFAGEVRSVVGTAAAFINSLLRVWAKGAVHIDDATFVDSGGGDRFWGLVLFAPAFERSQLIELIGAGPSPAMIHPGDHKKTKPVVLVRPHVFQDGLVIRDGIQGGDRAVGTSVAPTVIHEELAPACFEFCQIRADGVDLFPVQKCSVDVLFELEAAPIPSGILIANISEDVDVYGPGLGGYGWKAPAEFPTEGKARVDDFAIGFPHVGVGGVYSFQLLRGEAAFGLGAVAVDEAWAQGAVAGGFDEAVFNAVVAVALVKDCVIEQLQFCGRQRVLR